MANDPLNLENIDGLALVRKIFRTTYQETQKEGVVQVPCLNHEDSNPSAWVNINSQTWGCHVCGDQIRDRSLEGLVSLYLMGSAKGALPSIADVRAWLVKYAGAKAKGVIPVAAMLKFHRALIDGRPAVSIRELRNRGIEDREIQLGFLGFDTTSNRITIPILSEPGELASAVGLKTYAPGASSRKYSWHKSSDKAQCYQPWDLDKTTVVICGGELKALALRTRLTSLEVGVISGTLGEGAAKWNRSHTLKLLGKRVFIVYDIDAAGKRGAISLARVLAADGVEEIYIVELPLDERTFPKGDLCDWIAAHNPSSDECMLMLSKGVPVSKMDSDVDAEDVYQPADPPPADLAISLLPLDTAEWGKYRINLSSYEGIATAVQSKVEARCDKKETCCGVCKLVTLMDGEWRAFSINQHDAALLGLVNSPEGRMADTYKKMLGVPKPCKKFRIRDRAQVLGETVNLTPAIVHFRTAAVETGAIICGPDQTWKNGNCYTAVGHWTSLPASGKRTLFLTDLRSDSPGVGTKSPDPATLFEIHSFQSASPLELVEWISADITRIYQQDLMHLAVLTTLFSPVTSPASSLVVSDTASGKSQICRELFRALEIHESATVNGALLTPAGLTAGVKFRDGQPGVDWGAIPRRDGSILLVDEAQTAPPEIWPPLLTVMENYQVSIDKIASAKADARTRLVFLANAPMGQSVGHFPFPLSAVEELTTSAANLRRFTLVLCPEPTKVPNPVTARRTFDLEAFRTLYQLAQNNGQHDRPIEYEFDSRGLAEALARKYASSDVPLLGAAVGRTKIEKLAASFAALRGGYDSKGVLICSNADGEWAVWLLESCAVSLGLGNIVKVAQTGDMPDRTKRLSEMHPTEVLLAFSRILLMGQIELGKVAGLSTERGVAELIIQVLVSDRLILRTKKAYIPTEAGRAVMVAATQASRAVGRTVGIGRF